MGWFRSIAWAIIDAVMPEDDIAEAIAESASEEEAVQWMTASRVSRTKLEKVIKAMVKERAKESLVNRLPKLKLLAQFDNSPKFQQLLNSNNGYKKSLGFLFKHMDKNATIKPMVEQGVRQILNGSKIPLRVQKDIMKGLRLQRESVYDWADKLYNSNRWIWLTAEGRSDHAIQGMKVPMLRSQTSVLNIMYYRNKFTKHNEAWKRVQKRFKEAQDESVSKMLRGSNIYAFYKVPTWLIFTMAVIRVIPNTTPSGYKIGAYYVFYWAWYKDNILANAKLAIKNAKRRKENGESRN